MVIEKILSITELERCNNTKESINQWLEFDMRKFSIDSIISLEDYDIGGV